MGRVSRSHRWDYMGHPAYNPPTEDCPTCAVPSRVHAIGGRLVEEDRSAPNGIGWSEHSFECEHGHRWVVPEKPG